jgi:hypothetical protein
VISCPTLKSDRHAGITYAGELKERTPALLDTRFNQPVGSHPMDNDELNIFLEGLNIDRFEVALKSESDPAKRKQIEGRGWR